MGVALGHRDLGMSSHASMGVAERNVRESRAGIGVNPITGELTETARRASRCRDGVLGAGFVPKEDSKRSKEFPNSRPDPTKNRNNYLGSGCVPSAPEPAPPGPPSRTFESCLDGMVEREKPAQDGKDRRRASNPLLGGSEREPTEAELCRPRDQLGPGLMGPADQVHPEDLPRKPCSSLRPGAAYGGETNLCADKESGFLMPRGDKGREIMLGEAGLEPQLSGGQNLPFRRAYGAQSAAQNRGRPF